MNSLSLLAAGIERVTNASKNNSPEEEEDDDGNNEEINNNSGSIISNDAANQDIQDGNQVVDKDEEEEGGDDDDGYEDLASSDGDEDYDDELSNSSEENEEQQGNDNKLPPLKKTQDQTKVSRRNSIRSSTKPGYGSSKNKSIRFDSSSPATVSKSHLRRNSSNRFNLSDSEQLKTHLDSYHKRVRQKLQQKKKQRLSKSNSSNSTTKQSSIANAPPSTSSKFKNPFSLVWIWSFIKWLFISPLLAVASLFSLSLYKRKAASKVCVKPKVEEEEAAHAVQPESKPKLSWPTTNKKPLPNKIKTDEDEWGSSGDDDEESSSAYSNAKQVRFGLLPAPHSLKSPNSGTSLLVEKRKQLIKMRNKQKSSKEQEEGLSCDDITSEIFSFSISRVLVPRQVKQEKKTLIMDLDETLIHSLSRETQYSNGHMIEVKLTQGRALLYYVHKRPHCDEFLSQVSKWYELVIFTASVQQYADPVIDWLDQDKQHFKRRYYRQDCSLTYDGYTKDITIVNSDLSKVIIIDNSPISYALYQNNAIPIEGWISDPTDNDLMNLLPVLYSMRYSTDIRSILALRFGEMG